MTARVIARPPSVWYSTATIDTGSKDGVAVNDPVVNGDGLVGRVTDVAPVTAKVTLITDPRAASRRRCCRTGPGGRGAGGGRSQRDAPRLHRQERAHPLGPDRRHVRLEQRCDLVRLARGHPGRRGAPRRRSVSRRLTSTSASSRSPTCAASTSFRSPRAARSDQGLVDDRHVAHRPAHRGDRGPGGGPAGVVLLLPDPLRNDANIIPLVAVSIGLLGGAMIGAICGFILGFVLDRCSSRRSASPP